MARTENRPEAPTPELSSEDPGASTQGDVLLIDDNEVFLRVIGRQLSAWGFSVTPAQGGAAGLDCFNPDTVHVVVTDAVMPEISGLDVLQTLTKASPNTPVVMLALYSELKSIMDAVQSGAFDYIVKDEIHIIRRFVLNERVTDDRPDPLRSAVQRAVNYTRLLRANDELVRDLWQANEDLSVERAQLREALEKLKKTQFQLVQAEKAASLALLTAGVGNEINNPLAILGANFGVLEMWTKEVLEEESVRATPMSSEIPAIIHDCVSGVRRIQQTVDQLRTFSSTSTAASEPVELAGLMANLAALLRGKLSEHATLAIECASAKPVRGHAGRLRQVLLNLLGNAIDACSATESKGVITLKANNDGDHVRIHVLDNGAGIQPENLGKIFDPFFTTKQAQRATGLGLSVAREMIRTMDGTIEASSSPGEQTCVTITLPSWEENDG